MMNLVRDTSSVDRYQRELKERFTASAVRRKATIVAARLTEEDRLVYWDRSNGVWAHFSLSQNRSRYWNPFGIDNPDKSTTLLNIVQINPSRYGHLTTGGAFIVDDASDSVFLAHSGKIGGQHGGETAAFLAQFETVALDVGRKMRRYVIIADLRDPDLNQRIAAFVALCARFKEKKRRRRTNDKSNAVASGEYDGAIEYVRKGYVRTRRAHGLIYKALRRELERRRVKEIGRDVNRDLFCGTSNSKTLFEIKTDCDTTSVYTGVGQLMLHGTAEGYSKYVLVCPNLGKAELKRLRKLGIFHVGCKVRGERVEFTALDAVLSTT